MANDRLGRFTEEDIFRIMLAKYAKDESEVEDMLLVFQKANDDFYNDPPPFKLGSEGAYGNIVKSICADYGITIQELYGIGNSDIVNAIKGTQQKVRKLMDLLPENDIKSKMMLFIAVKNQSQMLIDLVNDQTKWYRTLLHGIFQVQSESEEP